MEAILEQLTKRELEALFDCEAEFGAHRKAWESAGRALMRIRDERLYRGTHRTFEAYLGERWKLSKSYAHSLISSSAAAENVRNCGQTGPTCEAQARELAAVPADQQAEVWQEAAAETGDVPTAADVRRTVKRRRDEKQSSTAADAQREAQQADAEAADRIVCREDQHREPAERKPDRRDFNLMLVDLRDCCRTLTEARKYRPPLVYHEQLRMLAEECIDVLGEILINLSGPSKAA